MGERAAVEQIKDLHHHNDIDCNRARLGESSAVLLFPNEKPERPGQHKQGDQR